MGFGAVMGRVGRMGRMGIVGKRGHHLFVRQCKVQGSDNADYLTPPTHTTHTTHSTHSTHNPHNPNFLSEVVRCGISQKKPLRDSTRSTALSGLNFWGYAADCGLSQEIYSFAVSAAITACAFATFAPAVTFFIAAIA